MKYKGRWVTADEKTKRDAADKLSAAQGSWIRRVRMLRNAIVNGPNDRRREAESQLMAIRDPDAVVPLVRVFGQDDAPRRVLLALVLSTIGGPEATSALIERVLAEPDAEVRSITFEHLKQRGDAGIAGRFVRALGREDIKVINRAAWALGNLNSQESVPHLVTVLVTSEDRIVVPNLDNLTPNVPGPRRPDPPCLQQLRRRRLHAPRREQRSRRLRAERGPLLCPATGRHARRELCRTEQAAPGCRTSRPSPIATSRSSARSQKLTGEDFGYDVEAWRRWVTRSFNPHPRPSRRVPQP